MKVIAKPIELISITKENGSITPIKFKYKNDDESTQVIKIDRILFSEKEKLAGNIMYLYRCQSLIDDLERIYELKYELSSCKWVLYKM